MATVQALDNLDTALAKLLILSGGTWDSDDTPNTLLRKILTQQAGIQKPAYLDTNDTFWRKILINAATQMAVADDTDFTYAYKILLGEAGVFKPSSVDTIVTLTKKLVQNGQPL
jgi:hypothetical protein